LKAVTNEKGKKKRTNGSNPTARLNAKSAMPTLPELVRTKMRCVPQSVTIVTSSNTQTHPHGNPQGWHGATISSFSTVTLRPVPIISFNIKNNSSTFAAIKASGRLWVHFLTLAPSATDLAKQFAKKGHRYPRSLTRGRTEKGHEKEAAQQQPAEVPLISSEMGAGARIAFILECIYMKDKTVSIGDHVVLFASLADVINTASNYVFDGTGFQHRRPCLVYADGEYQGVTPLENSSMEQKPLNMSRQEE
jgi:flavin reductase (DIM6/NTAB) family NADH-FMN oxidoreductase RutF